MPHKISFRTGLACRTVTTQSVAIQIMLSSCYHDFDDMSTYFSSSIVHFSQFVLLRAHNGNIRTLRNRFGILMNDKTSSSAFFRFIERSVGLCQKLCYVMWKQKMVRSDAAAH